MDNLPPSRKSHFGFVFWIQLGFLICVLYFFFFPGWWPPLPVVRRDQRKTVIERVQAGGGWAALQRACDTLVETNRDSRFQWLRGFASNALPPAIAALQPQEVSYYSPKMVRSSIFETEFDVVRIKVFGLHRTGAHAYPYFGLEVVSSTNAARYTPRPSLGGASGNGYDGHRRITESIYEIYGSD